MQSVSSVRCKLCVMISLENCGPLNWYYHFSSNHYTQTPRMASWVKNPGYSPSVAAIVIIFFILLSKSSTVQAPAYGHVDIVNAFRSATQFTCHSNKAARQSYTASSGEIYYFSFNTAIHQYWDCQVDNKAARVSDTFRFYGDDSHGGPALWSYTKCVFNVQVVGVYLYHDGKWIYIHH